jgi:hypothetical protein
VVLEVTETTLAGSTDGGIAALRTPMDTGVRVAIDDFARVPPKRSKHCWLRAHRYSQGLQRLSKPSIPEEYRPRRRGCWLG